MFCATRSTSFFLTAHLFSLFGLILGHSVDTSVDDGRLTTLSNVPYYVGGVSIAKLSGISNHTLGNDFNQDLFPITIIHITDACLSLDEYNTILSAFKTRDDVFQDAFLRTAYVVQTAGAPTNREVCASIGDEYHQTKHFLGNGTDNTDVTLNKLIPNGPYFFSAATGNIFKAYRLYPDRNLAFTQAAVSDERGGFLTIPGIADSVAVPSRLYYTPSTSQPLAGLRMAVKDIYSVKGLRTSGGSRAYFDTYGEQNATAPSIQRLIDQGAILVGKTGTAQFANGDRPTVDWVDFHCPFNPRGDGYQSPSGSSTGSATAVASYKWLDIAVGSDTGGSMRSPARLNGVFGNRPSTGAISMDGVLPLSPHFDTAGVFTRSGALWSKITRLWYQDGQNATSTSAYPKRIYVSSNSSTASPEPQALFNSFLARLERFLDANRTIVDVRQHWHDTHPSNLTDDLDETLKQAYAVLTSVDQYALLGRPFLADYAARHAGRGRRPFLNPNPRARWAWGRAHGDAATYAAAVRNATAFRAWWETSGPGRRSSSDPCSCSEGLYVYLGSGSSAPSYRDEYLGERNAPPLEFADWTIAGYAGAPEVVLPLGEARYESRITGATEWLPVSVNVQAARGCDGMLAGLVAGLEAEGIVRPVGVGSRLYG